MIYYYLLIGILLLLILTFPFVLGKLSQESGWRKLQAEYATKLTSKTIKGEPLDVKSALIGGFSYRNVLRFVSTKKGLFIRMTWPFSMRHKAVLIPWRYIKKIPAQKKDTKTTTLQIGQSKITQFTFTNKNFKKINSVLVRRGN